MECSPPSSSKLRTKEEREPRALLRVLPRSYTTKEQQAGWWATQSRHPEIFYHAIRVVDYTASPPWSYRKISGWWTTQPRHHTVASSLNQLFLGQGGGLHSLAIPGGLSLVSSVMRSHFGSNVGSSLRTVRIFCLLFVLQVVEAFVKAT